MAGSPYRGMTALAAVIIAGGVLAAGAIAQTTMHPSAPGTIDGAAGQVAAQSLQAQTAPLPASPDQTYAADDRWTPPGGGEILPAETSFADPTGRIGLLNTSGPIDTRGNPFFEPLGPNGRACVTCHQPSDAMGLSVATVRARWAATGGKDPMFAAVDGSDCPDLPQDKASSHALLLSRGLFRIFLPWPPRGPDGAAIKPEFKIEIVQDPTGCNTDPVYGLHSANPMISVYRRPRPVANMKYVVGPDSGLGGPQVFSPKNIAMAMARDPETGRHVSMQIMADAREPTLKTQAVDASVSHLQMASPPPADVLARIVAFEMQIYAGQVADTAGGSLVEPGGPKALGPHNLADNPAGILGDNYDQPVFHDFNMWKDPVAGESPDQAKFRQSVARGYDIFFSRPFWIRDVQHINTVGIGNPAKRTCSTCHNMQMTGMDLASGWSDLGTQNFPWAEQGLQSPLHAGQPQLPLFKITCDADAPPHMFLGRVIYTHDPGRALITGRCMDVGSIVMQQFRGLAARAPYFSNGSAGSLRELVDFYDRRFSIGFSEQEKEDLINFLSVL